MSVLGSEELAEFEEAVTDVMYRIEGVSHFTIDHFFNFEYLSNYDQLLSPSIDELIDQWYTTLSDYNNELINQLKLSEAKQAQAVIANDEVSFSAYVNLRVRQSLITAHGICLIIVLFCCHSTTSLAIASLSSTNS